MLEQVTIIKKQKVFIRNYFTSMAGQQNYLELSKENYFIEAEAYLKKSAESLYLNNKFGIGKKEDRDKIRHNQLLYSILCPDEIDLIEWIARKINGTLQLKRRFKDKDYDQDLCGASLEDINDCCNWEKIEW